ncbi:MAG: N-acetyltransferase [Candidatus Babeliales bacterium]|nr:N-acetyltransferase [Candidatus Babeliales bacterium]
MKKIIILLVCFSTHAYQIEKYQEINHKEQVIAIINNDDQDNYFMMIPPQLSCMERVDFITANLLHPRKEFIHIISDNNEVVGLITLTKRQAPSRQYAQQLKLLGSYYDNYIAMMLADPNLPEQSEKYVVRATLIIKKNYRNKGYGRKLLLFAQEQAKQDPEIDEISLDVSDLNTIAIKLYESLGYKRICHNPIIKKISYKLSIK